MLEPAGAVAWTLTYNSDVDANLAGGDRTGAAYLQRVGLIADADLERLAGWRGARLHASVHAINGRGLSEHYVGNALTVSGIEAEPALRLFNLWIEQSIGRHASVRVGQFTAGQEFMISPTAALFVNSTFGWPGSFASDLPGGGPAYPLAAPGVRLALQGEAGTAVRIAMFAGDPAGPGSGDPQRRNLHGFNAFRLAGSPFLIAEAGHDFGGTHPWLKLVGGGWVHFGQFDDVAGKAAHSGNYAIYGIADARLWTSGKRTVHGFLRASASPSDRNPVDFYADAGIALTAPFANRPNDSVGVAVGVARISPRLRSSLQARGELLQSRLQVPPAETAIEFSYRFMLNSNAYLQPNAQWILHPAGGAVSDESNAHPPRSAFVLGVRTSLIL